MYRFITIIMPFVFLFSCGASRMTQKISDDVSYIQLTGKLKGINVRIDGKDVLSKNRSSNDIIKIKTLPGKHLIQIYRGSELIYEKSIILFSEDTFEKELL